MIENINLKCKIYEWDKEDGIITDIVSFSQTHPAVGYDSASLILDLSSFYKSENNPILTPFEIKLLKRDTTYRIEVFAPDFLGLEDFLIFKGIILAAAGSRQGNSQTLQVEAVSDFYFLDRLQIYLGNPASVADAVLMTEVNSRIGVPEYFVTIGSLSMYLYSLFNEVFPKDSEPDYPSLHHMMLKIFNMHNEFTQGINKFGKFTELLNKHLKIGNYKNRIISSIYTGNVNFKTECSVDKDYLVDYFLKPVYGIFSQETMLNFATNQQAVSVNGTNTSYMSLLNNIYGIGGLTPCIHYIRTEINEGPKRDSYIIYKPSFTLFRPISQNFIPLKLVNGINYSVNYNNIPTRTLLEVQHPYLQNGDLTGATIDLVKNSAVSPLKWLEENVKVITDELEVENNSKYVDLTSKNVKTNTLRRKDYSGLITPEEESRGYISSTQQIDSKGLHFLNFQNTKSEFNPDTIYKLIKIISEYKLEESRLVQLTASISMPFNPFIKPGYPCILIDNGDLEYEDGVPTDIYAYVQNVSHSISQGQATTNISLTSMRPAFTSDNSISKDDILNMHNPYDTKISELFPIKADDNNNIREMASIEPVWTDFRNIKTIDNNYKTCTENLTKYYLALGMWWLNSDKYKVKEYDKNGKWTGKYKNNVGPYDILMNKKYSKNFRDPESFIDYIYSIASYELSEHYYKLGKSINMINSIDNKISDYKIVKDDLNGNHIEFRDISGKPVKLKLGKQHTSGRWTKLK